MVVPAAVTSSNPLCAPTSDEIFIPYCNNTWPLSRTRGNMFMEKPEEMEDVETVDCVETLFIVVPISETYVLLPPT